MDRQWPADWLRGALEVCVLQMVGRGPVYGYAVAQALQAAGLGTVKGGTLYPLLNRLEQAGLVDVEWRPGEAGPGRKYYTLTALGRSEVARLTVEWLEFQDRARAVLVDETTSADDALLTGDRS
jgi:PadR family transcriptional regulator, regulatory protein PadR